MIQQPLHGPTLVLLTLGLSLGTFMQVLDSSIANVSLPAISGDLAVSPNQGTWVITSFAVSNAIALTVVSLLALSLLVAWELTDRHPVVDFHLFGDRNFLVGPAILSVGYLVFFGNVVVLPLWLQTNMGYTATWAGMAAAPIGILPVFLSAVVGKNMHKVDLRIRATFSFGVFAAVSFWNSHFNTDVTFQQIVIPRLLMGFGVATFFVPLTSLTLSGIPREMMPSATGLSNFFHILAGSFGTSLSITLWDRRAGFHHSLLTSHISAFEPGAGDLLGNPATDPAMLDRIIGQPAVLMATNDLFRLSGCFFAALMVLVWLAKTPRHGTAAAGSGPH